MDMNTWKTISSLATPILILLLAGLGWLYKHEREKRTRAEEQLNPIKRETYEELVSIFFDIFKDQKKNKDLSPENYTLRLMEAGKKMMLFASDEIFLHYRDWFEMAKQGKVSLLHFGNLIIKARKDMGLWNTKITGEDILRMLLTDFDEAKKQGLIF